MTTLFPSPTKPLADQLPRRFRPVVRALQAQSGRTEQEMALDIGLSHHSFRQYLSTLKHQFGIETMYSEWQVGTMQRAGYAGRGDGHAGTYPLYARAHMLPTDAERQEWFDDCVARGELKPEDAPE